MATSEEVLAVAAGELGYRESAGGRNKYGAWYGMDGVAWCMQFVQWVYAHAGAPLPFKTPSCGGLLRWYRRNQPACVAREGVPGCIVIFNFPGTKHDTDHTGLFVSETATHITTIDGNTSGENDANGGCVRRRTRRLSYANPTYIIPLELEENMRRFQTLEEIKRETPWAAGTVEALLARGALAGTGAGLDLSADMLRMLVVNDRAGAYGRQEG